MLKFKDKELKFLVSLYYIPNLFLLFLSFDKYNTDLNIAGLVDFPAAQ